MRVRIYTLSKHTFFWLLTWIKSQVYSRSKAHYTANEIGFYLLTDMWGPHHITTSFLHLVGRIFLIKWICVEIRQHNAFNSFDEWMRLLYISEPSTPKTWFSEPRFSEILDLMNKILLPFSYSTLYQDSIDWIDSI